MVEKLRDVSVAARTIQRDQVPEDVVGAVVYLCGPALRLRHRPDDRDRRRPVLPLRLSLYEHPDGVETGRRQPRRLRRRARRGALRRGAGRRATRSSGSSAETGGGRAPLRARSSSTRRRRGSCAATGSTSRPAAIAYRHTHPGPGHPLPPARRAARSTREGDVARLRARRGLVRARPPTRCSRPRRASEETAFVRVLLLPGRVGRASGRSATSTRPTRRSRSSSARRSSSTTRSRCDDAAAAAGSSSTSSSCTASSSPSACPGESYLAGARRAARLADPLRRLPPRGAAPRTWPRRTGS